APRDAARNFALGRPGYGFADLFVPARLAQLDAEFRAELAAADPALAARFAAYRGGVSGTPPEDSELLIAVARHLSRFVAELFGNQGPRQRLLEVAAREAAVFRMKEFIARRAIKKHAAGSVPTAEAPALRHAVSELAAELEPAIELDDELRFGLVLSRLLDEEQALAGAPPPPELKSRLDLFERWGAVHQHDEAARQAVRGWVSFRFPHKIDPHNLVPIRRNRPELPNATTGPEEHRRRRDGFALTDHRMERREVAS